MWNRNKKKNHIRSDANCQKLIHKLVKLVVQHKKCVFLSFCVEFIVRKNIFGISVYLVALDFWFLYVSSFWIIFSTLYVYVMYWATSILIVISIECCREAIAKIIYFQYLYIVFVFTIHPALKRIHKQIFTVTMNIRLFIIYILSEMMKLLLSVYVYHV